MAGFDNPAFGGKPLAPELQIDPAVASPEAQRTAPPVELVPVGAVLQGTSQEQKNVAAQAASVPRASMFESFVAAAANTDTASIIELVSRQAFRDDPDWSNSEAFASLDFLPTEVESEFLQKTKGAEEWAYRVGRVKQRRKNAGIAADHGIVSGAVAMLDPAYIGADLLSMGAARVARVGKLAAGAGAGVAAGAVSAAAAQVSPISDAEIYANIGINMAATSLVYRKGKMQPADDFPADEAAASLSKFNEEFVGPAPHGVETVQKARVRVVDTPDGPVFEEVAPAVRRAKEAPDEVLHPNAGPQPPEAVEAAVETKVKSRAQELGEKLQWNMRKTLSRFGVGGDEAANLLFDNNSNLARNSAESHKRAAEASLARHQKVYEDVFTDVLKKRGAGLWNRITKPTAASEITKTLDREVELELLRREQLGRQGREITHEGVAPEIKELADAHDAVTASALKELKAAGVAGAEDLVEKSGWARRHWSSGGIDSAIQKLQASGKSAAQAKGSVIDLVALSLRRANGWDNELSRDIAGSIVNRTMRKGMLEDTLFSMNPGAATNKQMRDILSEELSGPRLERAMAVLTGKSDEAGKAAFLKHRVELDYRAAVPMADGSLLRVVDLLDMNTTTNLDRYLRQVSGQVGLARVGLKSASDIDALRTRVIESTPAAKRVEAQTLFDNVINQMHGRPAGDKMNSSMRNLSTYGRMIALANSGLWQFTEYATIMAKYGMGKTLKHMMREMPVFKSIMGDMPKNKQLSTQMRDILANQSENDLRLRPYIQKFEDGFEMDLGSGVQLAMQQAEQLVPYVNVMKYVHGHQARVTANLIVDRFKLAAKGDAKARDMLKRYGIEGRVMDRLSNEIKLHGTDVSKWDDAVWLEARPAFSKMMDEGVLHARLGDMPAFAMFDQTGKFIFTYRSFVMAAHNKILAGTAAREGFSAAGLLLLYQFPLAVMAVQAQAALTGKGDMSESALINKAIGQMGGLGWFAEAYAVLSGDKEQFGSPGMIPVDRMYSTLGALGTGDADGAMKGAVSLVPLFSLIHPIRNFDKLTEE